MKRDGMPRTINQKRDGMPHTTYKCKKLWPASALFNVLMGFLLNRSFSHYNPSSQKKKSERYLTIFFFHIIHQRQAFFFFQNLAILLREERCIVFPEVKYQVSKSFMPQQISRLFFFLFCLVNFFCNASGSVITCSVKRKTVICELKAFPGTNHFFQYLCVIDGLFLICLIWITSTVCNTFVDLICYNQRHVFFFFFQLDYLYL